MKILGIDPGIGRLGFGLIEFKVQSSKFKVKDGGGLIRRPLAETSGVTPEGKGDALVRTTGNNEYKVSNYGCFETKRGNDKGNRGDKGDKGDDGRRLYEIHCFLKELIEKEKPDEVAVESLFFAQNVKTAMMVSQARGAILLTIAQAGLPAFSYTPLQVKQALTGYGRAEKKQVQKMVQVILGMDAPVKQDDAADALAVAVTHAFSRKLGKLMK